MNYDDSLINGRVSVVYRLIVTETLYSNPRNPNSPRHEVDVDHGEFATRAEAEYHAREIGSPSRYTVLCMAHGRTLCGQCDQITV